MPRIQKTSKPFMMPHRTRQKYSRISNTTKESLFNLIYFNGKKIKEVNLQSFNIKKAAEMLNINYSSAKTLLYLKRLNF